MKGTALSITQPWAWLIVNGYKDIENRNWKNPFRGMIYVHSGKRVDNEAFFYIRDNNPEIVLPDIEIMGHGGFVGMVEIVDCVERSDSPWFFGPYGFVLRNPKPIPFVPYQGNLGFFKFNTEKPEWKLAPKTRRLVVKKGSRQIYNPRRSPDGKNIF